MTREEAVIILDGFKNNPLFNSTHARAFDMAISALSENKGDLISRQAVLYELKKWDWQDLYLPIHFKQILDDVPSVENKEEWIPVSEENLPEDFQEVLVTVVRCNGTRVVRAAEYHENPSLSRKIFRILENNERWEVGEDGLIAWMPKPEPCKAESEEK